MRLALALLLALSTTACGAVGSVSAFLNDASGTVDVGGLARQYIIHVPRTYDRSHPVALVIVLHGGYGTPEGTQRISGMDAVADEHGFIAVYPRGISKHWDDGRSSSLQNPDDVRFVAAMIDQLERQYRIDPDRVYATGLSNGAIFSLRLACELDGRIAAVASVAGSVAAPLAPSCRPKTPVSVLLINGTSDPLVPYGGGMVAGRTFAAGPVISVPQSVALWTSIDRCAATPSQVPMAHLNSDDPTTTTKFDYEHCSGGASVELLSVAGGGHTWPGGPQYLPAFVIGQTSRDFNASETIWQFFEAHPKQRA
jgi:polyhydroxybutyrate depolymerase